MSALMPAETWSQVRDVFERALEQDPADPERWLAAAACTEGVRAEVASLLRYHARAGRFLGEPVAARVPDLLDEQASLKPGQSIGSYVIVRELGSGGMGRVYLASDQRLKRLVAIKALLPRLTTQPSSRERFRREAQAAAALTHSGICTVYALEEVTDDLYIVTEYVEGRTLREDINSGTRPSPALLRETAQELASALAAAHSRGIIHRDLKPENVLRAIDGHIKILDFGVAHIDDDSGRGPRPRMTQPGFLVGTPAYMAPEQLNGEPADARADIFALGVLLYEYACGSHPFEAATPIAMMSRILGNDVPPVAGRLGHVAPDVADVIERCLQKNPGDRWPSAAAIVLLLQSHAAVATSSSRWWRVHQLAVLVLYVGASVVAWGVKERLETPASRWLFVGVGIGAALAGIVRGHLVFTQWMNPRRLVDERRRTAVVTLAGDLWIGVCLAVSGLLLVPVRPLYAVLTIALAIGVALARVLMEPATTVAALGRR